MRPPTTNQIHRAEEMIQRGQVDRLPRSYTAVSKDKYVTTLAFDSQGGVHARCDCNFSENNRDAMCSHAIALLVYVPRDALSGLHFEEDTRREVGMPAGPLSLDTLGTMMRHT